MNINEQKCPNCAGKLLTDLNGMKKECPFCGAVFVIKTGDEKGISFVTSEDEPVVVKQANTKYSIKLLDVGPNKVKAIKVLRELTGLGLKESKDIIEAAPIVLINDVDKEEADRFVNTMKSEVQGIVLEAIQ